MQASSAWPISPERVWDWTIFFTRPICLALLVVAAVTLIWPWAQEHYQRRVAEQMHGVLRPLVQLDPPVRELERLVVARREDEAEEGSPPPVQVHRSY